MHKVNLTAHNFKIEGRRRRVSSLLAQSMTESEIAQELNVDQSTISRDIKVLKELSQQFVYNLAKSDLACHYKHCIDGREEVRMRDFLQQTQSYTKIHAFNFKNNQRMQ